MQENQGNQANSGSYIMGGLAIVLAFVIGILSYSAGKTEGSRSTHMGMMNMENAQEKNRGATMDHKEMTMDQMTAGLQGLEGDAFDKAFVEMMIVHHEGAVDMAKLIPAQAKNEELKKLGIDIISAQTKEIEMMKSWLKAWGYEESLKEDHSNMPGMDHSMMGM